MQYLMILADEESNSLWPGDPGFEERMAEHLKFRQMVEKLGIFRAANRLRPVSTATTVRVRGGKTLCTDGPFAETKEQLGGFYLLECRDLDHALELAAQIPTAKTGSIEVRPVVQ
jgi:hypothetical protein